MARYTVEFVDDYPFCNRWEVGYADQNTSYTSVFNSLDEAEQSIKKEIYHLNNLLNKVRELKRR